MILYKMTTRCGGGEPHVSEINSFKGRIIDMMPNIMLDTQKGRSTRITIYSNLKEEVIYDFEVKPVW